MTSSLLKTSTTHPRNTRIRQPFSFNRTTPNHVISRQRVHMYKTHNTATYKPANNTQISTTVFQFGTTLRRTPTGPRLRYNKTRRIAPTRSIIRTRIRVVSRRNRLMSRRPVNPTGRTVTRFPNRIMSAQPMSTVNRNSNLLERNSTSKIAITTHRTNTRLLKVLTRRTTTYTQVRHRSISLIKHQHHTSVHTQARTKVRRTLQTRTFRHVLMSFNTPKLRRQLAVPIRPRPVRIIRRRPINTNSRTKPIRIFSTRRRTFTAKANQRPYTRRNMCITSIRTSQQHQHRSSDR